MANNGILRMGKNNYPDANVTCQGCPIPIAPGENLMWVDYHNNPNGTGPALHRFHKTIDDEGNQHCHKVPVQGMDFRLHSACHGCDALQAKDDPDFGYAYNEELAYRASHDTY